MIIAPLRRVGLLVLVSAVLSACVDNRSELEQQSAVVDEFDFLGMMANYADNIMVPNYQALSLAAHTLAAEDGVLAAYCDTLENDTSEPSAAVADAWLALQTAVQRSEMHVLGPVLANNGNLLNRINSYNSSQTSLCGIDQAVVQASEAADFDLSVRSTSQRGVTALEYLLFDQDLSHHCPSQIVETADWDQRPVLQRRQLRCAYAQVVARDLANSAEQLLQAWQIDGGNYRLDFINPNNLEDNFTALSDALFYLDVDVKDRKLGIPLGLNNQACAGIACADEVESPFAQASLAHIRHNLESFARQLTGGSGLGFDDVIAAAGVNDLNERFAANINEALALIDSMEDSLREQAANIADQDAVAACANAAANPRVASEHPACQLHGLLKILTDDLKVDFVIAVNVDLPERGQADND